ncbi:MAG: glycoside hydrolase family 16 protein [Chitinophagaceae bacterium]|nr:glycoside hydrolase family 16 protein [Chitinophagaceae bacterium]
MKRNLHQLTVICFAMILIVSCKKSGGDPAPEPPSPPDPNPPVNNNPVIPPTVYAGYSLLWNDEFDGSQIDVGKWNFETGTGIDGNFGTGQLDRARPDNATIATGVTDASGNCLAIVTKKETYIDRNYTSARLNTKDKGSWGPGHRIEARVWARDVRYKGQGFAFWMMPQEIPTGQTSLMWPQGGEIDIMEYVGSIPNHNLGSVHYAWSWENNQYQSWNHGHKGGYYSYAEKQVPATNPNYGGWPAPSSDLNTGSGGFHIYRIDWYANRIEFALDDQVYHINYFKDGDAFDNGVVNGQDQDAKVMINGKRVFVSEYSHHFAEWAPFSHKFFILLTAGVGGNDNQTYGGAIVPNAVFPCTTFIDWIRVYKRN